jgi:bifunctional non-homologous end joining protein LigD
MAEMWQQDGRTHMPFRPMNLAPIIPQRRQDPITDPGWAAELKLDGFRGLADTINARMLSKNLSPLKRFQHLLDALPFDCVFDGEICVLDSDGRPRFNDLLFGRGDPVYVVFDLLFYEGQDIRSLPLKERRAILDQVAKRYGLQKSELFIGCDKMLYRTVCEMGLEGVICKRLEDHYGPDVRWFKILNPDYSQKDGRHELFDRRYG